MEIPGCAALAKSCKDANFKAGGHKKNGHGLWIDCIGAIAKGKSAEGVTGHSQDEAQKCVAAMKATRSDKK